MSNWGVLAPYIRAWRDSWNSDLRSFKSRFNARLDMLVIDHGLFRYLYPNRFRVSPQVERRNHPTPLGVAMAARRGIKTIINLRGDNGYGSTLLSRQACERHGITMVDFKVYSRKAPSRELIREAKELFARVQYPVMLHCKSGADRAGLVSALYLILHEGKPVAEAKRQLNWYYGHIRQTKTGVMDYFFAAYEQANARQALDFMSWVEQQYDPVALEKAFKTTRWANALDRLMNRE